MHSRTESGIPLDWNDVPRIEREIAAERERLERLQHAIDAVKGRHPTSIELAEIQALWSQSGKIA